MTQNVDGLVDKARASLLRSGLGRGIAISTLSPAAIMLAITLDETVRFLMGRTNERLESPATPLEFSQCVLIVIRASLFHMPFADAWKFITLGTPITMTVERASSILRAMRTAPVETSSFDGATFDSPSSLPAVVHDLLKELNKSLQRLVPLTGKIIILDDYALRVVWSLQNIGRECEKNGKTSNTVRSPAAYSYLSRSNSYTMELRTREQHTHTTGKPGPAVGIPT